jgi:hypothetical protein
VRDLRSHGTVLRHNYSTGDVFIVVLTESRDYHSGKVKVVKSLSVTGISRLNIMLVSLLICLRISAMIFQRDRKITTIV